MSHPHDYYQSAGAVLRRWDRCSKPTKHKPRSEWKGCRFGRLAVGSLHGQGLLMHNRHCQCSKTMLDAGYENGRSSIVAQQSEPCKFCCWRVSDVGCSGLTWPTRTAPPQSSSEQAVPEFTSIVSASPRTCLLLRWLRGRWSGLHHPWTDRIRDFFWTVQTRCGSFVRYRRTWFCSNLW